MCAYQQSNPHATSKKIHAVLKCIVPLQVLQGRYDHCFTLYMPVALIKPHSTGVAIAAKYVLNACLAIEWHFGNEVSTSINYVAVPGCSTKQQAAAVWGPIQQHQLQLQLLSPDAIACKLHTEHLASTVGDKHAAAVRLTVACGTCGIPFHDTLSACSVKTMILIEYRYVPADAR